MAAPSLRNIDKNAIYIWDDANNRYVAWDGALNASDIEIGNIDVAKRSDGGDTDAANVGDDDKLYSASFESVAGQQVHIVGDGDKYVVSNAIEGSAVSNVDAIPIAYEDEDGKKVNARTCDKAVHYCLTTSGADAGAIMIDLSDTTNFPHTNTTRADICSYWISVQGNSSWDGVVVMGFINSIDGTDAEVTIVHCWRFDRTAGSGVTESVAFPNPVKGSTTYTKSPNLTLTYFNTGGTNTTAIGGTATPAVGDWVLFADRAGGEVSIGLTLVYGTV